MPYELLSAPYSHEMTAYNLDSTVRSNTSNLSFLFGDPWATFEEDMVMIWRHHQAMQEPVLRRQPPHLSDTTPARSIGLPRG